MDLTADHEPHAPVIMRHEWRNFAPLTHDHEPCLRPSDPADI
jgi:hypothetical protein